MFCLHVSRYHFACLRAVLDARKGVVLPVSAVTDVYVDRESNPGHLEEQPVLSSTEPPLQSLNKFNKSSYTQNLP